MTRGLALDVAVHLGTLLAVITYLRKDLLALLRGCLRAAREGQLNEQVKLVFFLGLASLPLVPAGLFVAPRIDMLRTAEVIAATTIGFGLALWLADRRVSTRTITELRWYEALVIGLAQALALVPGTSRSGITMTAAMMLGLSRVAAARFSFLLAIPAISASGAHQALDLSLSNEHVPWLQLAFAAIVAGVIALLVMHALLAWLQRAGMLPFVLYRLALGTLLVILVVLP